ncbi:hypothetical protein [Yinghuangia sp. YIM S09857]|uniref:hypothetical protein n=1 Tax=Yinghuangia sp. YIM S09857 TaxID=3436929 RepID=UPI003F53A4FF
MTHTPGSADAAEDGDEAAIDAFTRANILAFAAELAERGCPAEGLIDPETAEEDDEGRAEYRLFAVHPYPALERWIAMPGVELAVVRAAGPDDPWAIESILRAAEPAPSPNSPTSASVGGGSRSERRRTSSAGSEQGSAIRAVFGPRCRAARITSACPREWSP